MAADNSGRPAEATRVRRTGLTVIHEGEWVVAAAGAEAEFEAGGPDQPVINYYFPVEIEVVSTPRPTDHETLVDLTLGRLAEHLEGLA
jgi:hypothetical protein